MIDLHTLICEVCKETLKGCTCKDVDERVYTMTESLRVIAKQNRQGERLARLLSITHFMRPEDVEPKVELLPWEGARDKIFGPPEPRLEGAIAVAKEVDVDNQRPEPDPAGNPDAKAKRVRKPRTAQG